MFGCQNRLKVWEDIKNHLKVACNRTLQGFPCGSNKESACNVGDLGSIPGLGRSPWEGKGYALQYSGLENSMECMVHGVAKSQTRLSDFHFHFQKSKDRAGTKALIPGAKVPVENLHDVLKSRSAKWIPKSGGSSHSFYGAHLSPSAGKSSSSIACRE